MGYFSIAAGLISFLLFCMPECWPSWLTLKTNLPNSNIFRCELCQSMNRNFENILKFEKVHLKNRVMLKKIPSKIVRDQEYILLTKVTKALSKKLTDPDDIEVSQCYLSKCGQFALSENMEANFEGMKFMRSFLKILKNMVDNQPAVLSSKEEAEVWLEPKVSYMATKQLSDGSAVIYCANAKEPANPWTDNGLEKMLKCII